MQNPPARLPLAAAIASLIAALSAAAQQQNEQQLPEVRSTGSAIPAGSLEDASRGATRTDTPIKDVPASIVVVPMETLREQGVYDMNRALYNVSAVQPQMGGGYGFADSFTIRGQSIVFLRDGYPDGTAQNGYRRTMADVERIEVVKGPGSALYGLAGPGGSVNVVTKPPLSRAQVEVSALGGSFGRHGATLDAGGAVGPLATRGIVNWERADGYRGLSREIQEALPTLGWRPSARHSLVADYDHRRIETTPDNYGIVFDARGRVAGAPRDARYYSPMNFTEQTVDRASLMHEGSFGEGLTARTALIHDRRDIDFIRNAGGNGGNATNVMTGRTLREQHDRARYTTFQHEWIAKHALSGFGNTLLAGVQYNDTGVDAVRLGYNLPNIADILAPVVPEITAAGLVAVASQGFDRRIESRGRGAYVQDEVAIGERWNVRVAGRYDRVRFSDDGVQGGTRRTIAAARSLVSGSGGVVFHATKEWSFFAGASRGGFVNLSTEPTAVAADPERSRQFEGGVKASLFGGAADAQLAAFEVERTSYLIRLPGSLSSTPDGHDRTRGVELDLTARLAARLKVVANAYVQDAEVLSSTLATNAILGVVNRSIAGTRPSGVARTGGRFWALWQAYGREDDGLGIAAGVTRKGESFADSLNLYRVPGYAVWDAALYYRRAQWQAGVAAYNLTDRVHYTNPTFAGALPGDPRSVVFTLRWRFS